MFTEPSLHEMQMLHAEAERTRNAIRRDMIRLATATQFSLAFRIRQAIGAALVTSGEFLRREPANTEQRPTLSHS